MANLSLSSLDGIATFAQLTEFLHKVLLDLTEKGVDKEQSGKNIILILRLLNEGLLPEDYIFTCFIASKNSLLFVRIRILDLRCQIVGKSMPSGDSGPTETRPRSR